MSENVSPTSASAREGRRHDLDALRAFAMLLGVALHTALSFAAGLPWVVMDSRQNVAFSLFMAAVHGFRMPLFFLVSGFFTAMLWRRRGLRALLRNRATRILLPLLLGLVTIVPAVNGVSTWAAGRGSLGESQDDGSLVAAVRLGLDEAVVKRLDAGADASSADEEYGVTPLSWAVLAGRTEVLRLLIDRGADVNSANRDGSTPLHSAVFAGRPDAVKILLDAGARAEARNSRGETPHRGAETDWQTTEFLFALLRLPPLDRAEVERGRIEASRLLSQRAPGADKPDKSPSIADAAPGDRVVVWYRDLISSTSLNISIAGASYQMFFTPVFHHLWFLWFLCWLVPGFAGVVTVASRLGWKGPPRAWVLSPARLLWLVPLTLVPQWFMGLDGPSLGPDTSTGLLPQPHVLFYYAVFFGFGAAYHAAQDTEGRLGRHWWATLPLSFFFVLPVTLATMMLGPHLIAAVSQVAYAWLVCFGMMGLFRRTVTGENRVVRYVSDASYWLYLTHLPLVIGAQGWVRDWPYPASVKFSGIFLGVTAVLLVVYQLAVRHTWLGTLLNGPRPGRILEPLNSEPAVAPGTDGSSPG